MDAAADNQQKTLNNCMFGGMAHHPSFSLINVERSQKMKKTKESKKEYIRKEIIKASEIYRDKLAGKVFLFIYGDNWFEVVFKTDRFLHLILFYSCVSLLLILWTFVWLRNVTGTEKDFNSNNDFI